MTNNDIWAIGDIHGCFDEMLVLLNLIKEASPDGADVIFLADYIDRGPKSAEVIRFLMEGSDDPKFVFKVLKGNHEHMMLDAIKPGAHPGDIDFWLDNGGDATINSFAGKDYRVSWPTMYREPFWYQKANKFGGFDPDPIKVADSIPEDVQKWVSELPYYHEYDHHVFVHAGAHPGIPMAEQNPYDLMWMRRWENGTSFRVHGKDEVFDDAYGKQFEKHIVYGHTPRRDGVYLKDHCTGLDTGAVFGWGMTAGHFLMDRPGGPVALLQVPTEKYT